MQNVFKGVPNAIYYIFQAPVWHVIVAIGQLIGKPTNLFLFLGFKPDAWEMGHYLTWTQNDVKDH